MLHHKKVLLFFCLFASAAVLRKRLVRVAAKSATEATAGFDTPSFNGAQSVSNGIAEPQEIRSPGIRKRDAKIFLDDLRRVAVSAWISAMWRHQSRFIACTMTSYL
jgi:hypothetical protein